MLPGNNPFSPSPIPGCLVQILGVGGNGVADLPNLDGAPGSDDSVLYTTAMGQGITTNEQQSGRFSTAVFPPPANDVKIYRRVFNGTNVSSATFWGQSATFTVAPSVVMDVGVLGLRMTTMPKGINLTNTVDSKGLPYYQELIANTNPKNPNDVLRANSFVLAVSPTAQVNVSGQASRTYTLQRSTNNLNSVMTWADVDTTGLLTNDSSRTHTDPSPPRVFYHIKVTMP